MKPSNAETRCPWCIGDDLYVAYHDAEWGVPVHDDRRLFEFLILEGAQAGLSWITILRKRDNFRRAFDGFVPERIVRYDKRKLERLMQDAGIVRNRAKIEGTVANARAWLELMEEPGGFAGFLWGFVDGSPVQNRWRSVREVPAETDTSRALSKALRERGFVFVGPTIVYAFMQAVGMVNDHTVECFRHAEVGRLGRAPRP